MKSGKKKGTPDRVSRGLQKVNEMLGYVTNPGIRAFLKGMKDALELKDYYQLGGTGPVEDLLPPAQTEAQAKGRELGETLISKRPTLDV